MYIYKAEKDGGYAVGYWRPAGAVDHKGRVTTSPTFAVASRHDTAAEARARVSFLNGGNADVTG